MDIKEMNVKDIFKMYIDDIKIIRKDYAVFLIPEQDFIRYVLIVIKQCQEKYQYGEFKTYVIKSVKSFLLKKVNQLLNDNDYCYDVMSYYINNQFINTNNYSNSINNFNEMNHFINKFCFMPNNNVIAKLISNNNLFYNNLEVIYKRYEKQINDGKLNILFNNYLLIVCLEEYGNINGIKFQEDEIIEENNDRDLSDSLKTYLQEIGKYKILTYSEEQELFKRMENGDSEAQKIIIERNLKLVVSIAFKYSKCGISIQDLIEEGNIGLMTAIKKFDKNKEFKFSTYATWWIKRSILRYISNNRHTIRIPGYISDKIGFYKFAYYYLYNKYNEIPTRKEIAEFMNIRESLVEKIEKNNDNIISIDSFIGEDRDDTLESMITDPGARSIDEIAIEHAMVEDIDNIIENITDERVKDILKLRFGMNEEDRCYSLEEIGKKYHVTRERIRQIEAKTLRKLRHSSNFGNLVGYLDNPSSIRGVNKR